MCVCVCVCVCVCACARLPCCPLLGPQPRSPEGASEGTAGHTGRLIRQRAWLVPAAESLQWVPLSLSLTSAASSPPAPACGPCEVARLRQSSQQCCPEYECGMCHAWHFSGSNPSPAPGRGGRGGGAEGARGQEQGVDFPKPGKSSLWKVGFLN